MDVLRVFSSWSTRNCWHAAAVQRWGTVLRSWDGQLIPVCQQHQLRQHNTYTQQQQAGPSSSVLAKEAKKFAALANEWWRPSGPFAPLHRLNSARCKFLRDTICAMHGLKPDSREPLSGLSMLDVGCGGGILSESLARLGATVHGIDITDENVRAAQAHAQQDPIVAKRVRYTCTPLELLLQPTAQSSSATTEVTGTDTTIEPSSISDGSADRPIFDGRSMDQMHASSTGSTTGSEAECELPSLHTSQQQYDVVIASEVIEHVRRPDVFLRWLAKAVAPGGSLVVSTISRTPASFAVAIVGAEYITGMVPRGTHDWTRFITPQELYLMADTAELHLAHAAGMALQDGHFVLTSDLSSNYIVAFHKPASALKA